MTKDMKCLLLIITIPEISSGLFYVGFEKDSSLLLGMTALKQLCHLERSERSFPKLILPIHKRRILRGLRREI